jgi:hypothetical protein
MTLKESNCICLSTRQLVKELRKLIQCERNTNTCVLIVRMDDGMLTNDQSWHNRLPLRHFTLSSHVYFCTMQVTMMNSPEQKETEIVFYAQRSGCPIRSQIMICLKPFICFFCRSFFPTRLLIEEIIFPIFCHTDAYEEMWRCDPLEYIRNKFDPCPTLYLTQPAPFQATCIKSDSDIVRDSLFRVAQRLLKNLCRNRIILHQTMNFLAKLTFNSAPNQKERAVQMLGSLANILAVDPLYQKNIVGLYYPLIYPEFTAGCAYLQASVCWMLGSLRDCAFDNYNLRLVVRYLKSCLMSNRNEHKHPVTVQASIAIQRMLLSQNRRIVNQIFLEFPSIQATKYVWVKEGTQLR